MFTNRSTAASYKEVPGNAPVVFGFAARAAGDSEWAKQSADMRALKAERFFEQGLLWYHQNPSPKAAKRQAKV